VAFGGSGLIKGGQLYLIWIWIWKPYF